MQMSSLANNREIFPKASVLKFMKDFASKPNKEEAFYTLDLEDISYKVTEWRRLMPRVEIFYAMKCNSHKAVLHTLASLGTGFDCASQVEIEKALDLGVGPSRIIYAHPFKSKLDLQFASKVQVSLMTFDCKEELRKIKENYPEAELVLRIRCDSLDCEVNFGEKFGASLEDTRSILSLAHEMNLRVVGVAFHVGTSCKEITAFRRAIATAKQVFDEGKELGMYMNLLDLGGGFLGGHSDNLEDYAYDINDALDTYFPHRENHGLKCKGRNAEGGVDKETSETSIIWGPSLHPKDFLMKNAKLPSLLECGDWLYWTEMGAYTLEAATNFNGFTAPEVYVAVEAPEQNNYCQQRLNNGFEKPSREKSMSLRFCALMNVIHWPNPFKGGGK